jgi:anthranilate phosphoribosyltransferase
MSHPEEAQLGIREALQRVVDRRDLSADEMAAVVGEIMDGKTTPAQIGALLAAMRMKGETVDEVVGAARAMRSRMTAVEFAAETMVDTCGTGGDGSRSINVSTIAAFVVAGAGVTVPKHGNRAQSSQSGAHDVIEALGLNPASSPELSIRCLREAKLAFLFAPAHHAATKHAVGPRKELGLRTIFNLLGPLTIPCGVRVHVNGIFAKDRCELLARAHGALGSRRALVIHGAGGLDEFAPAGPTFVAELADGKLAGGAPADNARIALEVLDGRGPAAARNAVIMTAAAALYASGISPNLEAAADRASEVLAAGGALGVLETLRRIAPRAMPTS